MSELFTKAAIYNEPSDICFVFTSLSHLYLLSFYTRQHICYSANICYRQSICLSDGCIIEKRLKSGLWNFHHMVTPSL